MLDHERLNVYRASIEFIEWLDPVMADLPKTLSAREQLDRASTSVPLNIAEGNGKFTENDRCKFFDIGRGSALECAACFDVLVAKRLLTREIADMGKARLEAIVSMLIGLIRSNSSWRVHEERVSYAASPPS